MIAKSFITNWPRLLIGLVLVTVMAACGDVTPASTGGSAQGLISAANATISNSNAATPGATPTAATSARAAASNPTATPKFNTAVPSNTAGTGAGAGATTQNEACGLVTKAEAEAILGEPLSEPVYKYGCEYRSAAARSTSFPILAVMVVRNITREQMQAGTDNLAKAANKKPVVVEGIGDYAVDVDGLLYVLKGNVQVSIQPYDVNFDKQKRKSFALKALEKI